MILVLGKNRLVKIMEESILITIKKLLGLDGEDASFDTDIITHVNSFMPVLRQLGVDIPLGFYIEDASAIWADMLGSELLLATVKTWLYLRVRKIFDPPQNSTTMEAINTSIHELEWRINVLIDPEYGA